MIESINWFSSPKKQVDTRIQFVGSVIAVNDNFWETRSARVKEAVRPGDSMPYIFIKPGIP